MKLSVVLLISLCTVAFGDDMYSITRRPEHEASSESDKQLLFIIQMLIEVVNTMDMWLQSSDNDHSTDAVVGNTLYSDFLDFVTSNEDETHVLLHDLGKLIIQDKPDPVECSKPAPDNFFCNYRSLEEIIKFFENLASENPGHVSLIDVGTSYEGRTLYALRIAANNRKKPVMWIQSGQHAAEQIGPHVLSYLALQLTSLFGTPDQIILDTFDWYLLPLLNPDGYEYAQNVDRLWRRTRSVYPNERNCTGVDPNRNWDIMWNAASGSSSDPCDFYYSGPFAFSEAETRAVSQYMLNNLTGPLELFIDFHSYSQRWMSPYGYTPALPSNYDEQHRLSAIAVAAIKEVHGYEYAIGSSANILYNVTGGARDWAYDVMNATFSYTIELRDNGTFGFLLPHDQILPNCEEIWAGFKAMGNELVKIAEKDERLTEISSIRRFYI